MLIDFITKSELELRILMNHFKNIG